jgi:hypothetical protein
VVHEGERRQIGEHLGLGAPQDERLDLFLQALARLRAPVALDGFEEAMIERAPGAEQARVQEVEDAPQVAEVIFDGRARGGDAAARLQARSGPCPL